jgi:hypothetical protein
MTELDVITDILAKARVELAEDNALAHVKVLIDGMDFNEQTQIDILKKCNSLIVDRIYHLRAQISASRLAPDDIKADVERSIQEYYADCRARPGVTWVGD